MPPKPRLQNLGERSPRPPHCRLHYWISQKLASGLPRSPGMQRQYYGPKISLYRNAGIRQNPSTHRYWLHCILWLGIAQVQWSCSSNDWCWQQRKNDIFKEIYKSVSAFTSVKASYGGTVESDTFPVRRGVVQENVSSLLYFILALELILRRHDTLPAR